ncbi:MAG TPA: lysylphosphatidylglycerol synthase domain-containing protein [Streptosporangiaceae bacterium]|nr:lysylphosphatidylglycerol synthase domain-containing protein [Streptosporangiaceae bacterium]
MHSSADSSASANIRGQPAAGGRQPGQAGPAVRRLGPGQPCLHRRAGRLGAIEAALVAGLTGVGMRAGPAVSAVLLYRLATYWLPVLPGWLSWRFLQHRGYV